MYIYISDVYIYIYIYVSIYIYITEKSPAAATARMHSPRRWSTSIGLVCRALVPTPNCIRQRLKSSES